MSRRALPLICLLTGCYTYRPLPTPVPPEGQRVSAQLTIEGSRSLTAQIGPEVLHLEGNVIEADSAGFDLDVQQIESYRGIRSDWHGERVGLSPRGGRRNAAAPVVPRGDRVAGWCAGGGHVPDLPIAGPGIFRGVERAGWGAGEVSGEEGKHGRGEAGKRGSGKAGKWESREVGKPGSGEAG